MPARSLTGLTTCIRPICRILFANKTHDDDVTHTRLFATHHHHFSTMHNAGLISMRNTQYMAYYSIHEPYAWSRTNDNNTQHDRSKERRSNKGNHKGVGCGRRAHHGWWRGGWCGCWSGGAAVCGGVGARCEERRQGTRISDFPMREREETEGQQLNSAVRHMAGGGDCMGGAAIINPI